MYLAWSPDEGGMLSPVSPRGTDMLSPVSPRGTASTFTTRLRAKLARAAALADAEPSGHVDAELFIDCEMQSYFETLRATPLGALEHMHAMCRADAGLASTPHAHAPAARDDGADLAVPRGEADLAVPRGEADLAVPRGETDLAVPRGEAEAVARGPDSAPVRNSRRGDGEGMFDGVGDALAGINAALRTPRRINGGQEP